MLANNVQESTTTTGTGNITLAGSSKNGRTFTSQYSTNERFTYFIDDGAGNFETGIGYLSNSTTLVRENPQDGSAVLPVDFGVGTKQVFISVSANSNPSVYSAKPSSLITTPVICSSHLSNEGSSVTVTADRLYYVPFIVDYGNKINSIGYRGNAGISGSCHVGLYSVDANGDPSDLIISAVIDTSVGAISLGSVTEQTLRPGKYWSAIHFTAAASTRGNLWYRNRDTGMTGQNYESRPYGALYIDSQTLSSLPSTAIQPTSFLDANAPTVILGVV